MSALPAHIASYRERTWQVHELPFTGADLPQVEDDPRVLFCSSDSQMAADIGDDPNRLYVDLELLAADRNPSAGAQIGRLAADWNSVAAGTLTIVSYELVRDGKLVFLIENTQ